MEPAGTKHSEYSGRDFALAHCPACRFSCVVAPRTDAAQLYDERYYRGQGADPLVDYERELTDDRPLREYEWRGVVQVLEELGGLGEHTRWLDFGCGLGGLVRYARGAGFDIVGHDDGYAVDRLRQDGVPVLTEPELAESPASFDVVTAIEVLEHTLDPVAALRVMARALKPGGLLFLTTGNAEPFRGRLASWDYVMPDIHVSFFEPATLATALRAAELEPEFPGFVPGYRDIIRYKVLKSLRAGRHRPVDLLVPWSLASRVVDRRRAVTSQPVGRRASS